MIFAHLAILAFYGWLMISRRLSATLSIPLCALSIATVALLPLLQSQAGPAAAVVAFFNAMMTEVVEPGIGRLASLIFAVLLGAVLAAQMRISGAAERVVRYAAEYAGEDRFRLGLSMLLVIAVLFTTLGGLGAVILVASICLPVLFSLGIERRVAGAIFLLGLSLGGALNPVNWKAYQEVLAGPDVPAALRLELGSVVSFGLVLSLIFLAVAALFLLRQLSEAGGAVSKLLMMLASSVVLGTLAWLVFSSASGSAFTIRLLYFILSGLLIILTGLLLLRLLLVLLTDTNPQSWTGRSDNWLCAASMLVPIFLLIWSNLHGRLLDLSLQAQPQLAEQIALHRLDIPILTALLAGIVFCALSGITRHARNSNQLMQSLFEGVQQSAPAVVLLIGIGLLLKATMLESVTGSFQPLFSRLPLSNPIGYVGCFLVLSPLALYRGPLNLYGMGFGIMGILSAAGVLHGSLIMAAFFSVGMLQGVCDPTNTHNAWIANFCKVPVNELTRLLFPWISIIVLLGLVAGALMFHTGFAIPGQS